MLSGTKVSELMNEIKCNKTRFCLICGNVYDANVCHKCEAVQEARIVAYHSYRAVGNIRDKPNIPEEIKTKQERRLIQAKKEMLLHNDLSCYTQEQQKEYFSIFGEELESLLGRHLYFDEVFSPDENRVLKVRPEYFYENMRRANIARMCFNCKEYPCRYTRDVFVDMFVIKKCAETRK